jgi:hypothetical protein
MAYLAVLLGLMGNSEEQWQGQEGIAAAGMWVKHVQYARRYYAVIETAAEAGQWKRLLALVRGWR